MSYYSIFSLRAYAGLFRTWRPAASRTSGSEVAARRGQQQGMMLCLYYMCIYDDIYIHVIIYYIYNYIYINIIYIIIHIYKQNIYYLQLYIFIYIYVYVCIYVFLHALRKSNMAIGNPRTRHGAFPGKSWWIRNPSATSENILMANILGSTSWILGNPIVRHIFFQLYGFMMGWSAWLDVFWRSRPAPVPLNRSFGWIHVMFWFFLIGINALGWPCLSFVTGSISRSSMFLIYSEPSFASSHELFTEASVDYFRYEFTFLLVAGMMLPTD